MEAVTLKLPDTVEENELIRLSASWEDYVDALDEVDPTWTVQFLDNEIIMSQASDIHEELVSIMNWLLRNLFRNQPDYRVLSSNVKVVVPERSGDFNADVSVVRGPSEYALTPGSRLSNTRIKNPEIIVEILSKSTRKFDQTEKLTEYKLIPSLQHILFVDQYRPLVSVYSRTSVADE